MTDNDLHNMKAKEKPMVEPPAGLAKNLGGAPAGNTNRFVHGLRGALTIGSVPRTLRFVRNQSNRFRRAVEEQARVVHGHLTHSHEVLVNSATRAELIYLLATRELRDSHDKLDFDSKERLWKAMQAAVDKRDAALARLGLLDTSKGNAGGTTAPEDDIDRLLAAERLRLHQTAQQQNASGAKPGPLDVTAQDSEAEQ